MAAPRPQAARARHVVLGALAGVALAQLGVTIAFDRAPECVRFIELRRISRAMDAIGPANVDVVFLGSSRFGSALRPASVAAIEVRLREAHGLRVRVLGADVTAGDLIAMDYVSEVLARRGLRARLAVLEVSPETLAQRVRWINAHVVRQLRIADLPAALPQIRSEGRLSRVAWTRLLPIYWYRAELLEALIGRRPPYLGAPAAGSAPSPGGPAATEHGLQAIRSWLRDYRIGGLPAEALERLLGRLQASGTRVLVLGVPVSTPHRALYTPEIRRAYAARIAAAVAAHGAEYVDWSARLPDADFLDNHHLTPEGAADFGRLAADELIAPRLTRADAGP